MIKFSDKSNFIEISLIDMEQDKSLPSYGDAYISISVESNGFSGKNNLWVESGAISSFCIDLSDLERNRKGEANLTSMSPNELTLKVYFFNSRGHIGVSGKTSYNALSENASFKHSVEFGFEFDPSQLLDAVDVGWVKNYLK
jgi:hypothetical protein